MTDITFSADEQFAALLSKPRRSAVSSRNEKSMKESACTQTTRKNARKGSKQAHAAKQMIRERFCSKEELNAYIRNSLKRDIQLIK